ncbi:MAG: hypothetical protein HOW73_42890 [Polyangiaceae bacterium]|nr:hypothetical protein [Polyangiaceae bacterium]
MSTIGKIRAEIVLQPLHRMTTSREAARLATVISAGDIARIGVHIAAIVLVALTQASPARGDEPPPPRRKYGFGTAQGPNIASATLWTAPGRVGSGTDAALIGLTLPTFELQVFAPELYSIDLSTAVSGTVFAAGFDRALYFTQDVYFTFHLGRGLARFVGGPGIGFTTAFHEDDRGAQNGGSMRFVSQVGLELLTKNEAFGFRLLGRPWIEVTHVQSLGDERTFASGGFAQHFAFFGYFRQ